MRFASIVLLGVFCAAPAMAQQVGEYDGTTADGSPVTIDVAKDPNTGKLEVSSVNFDVDMLCQKSKETLSGVGIGLGDGMDISANGNFSYASSDYYFIDLVTSMTFHGKNTVKGHAGVGLSAFNPALTHEKLIAKTQDCVSPNQAFTATFTGKDTPHALPAGGIKVNPKDAR
jgi:hypothetical protein